MENYQAQENALRAAKRIAQDCLFKASSFKTSIKNVEKRLKEEQTNFEGCQKHMNNYHADYSEVKRLREQNAATLATLKEKVAQRNELIARLRDEQGELRSRLTAARENLESTKNEITKLHKMERTYNTSLKCSKTLIRICNLIYANFRKPAVGNGVSITKQI